MVEAIVFLVKLIGLWYWVVKINIFKVIGFIGWFNKFWIVVKLFKDFDIFFLLIVIKLLWS